MLAWQVIRKKNVALHPRYFNKDLEVFLDAPPCPFKNILQLRAQPSTRRILYRACLTAASHTRVRTPIEAHALLSFIKKSRGGVAGAPRIYASIRV